MKTGQAEFLLTAVIAARSTSYLFEKIGLESMEPFTLLGLRFFMAFLFLTGLFWKRLRCLAWHTIWRSFWLGLLLFGVMVCELHGLKTISSSLASFLENTAIVFVPLLEALWFKRWPKRRDWLSSLLILLGVALLVLRPNTFSSGVSGGVWLCLLAALLYALWIQGTGHIVQKEKPFLVGILGMGVVSFLSSGCAFLFEVCTWPTSLEEWEILLALAFVCSVFGFTLQPVAQRYISVEKASLFCALNPVISALLGYVFLNEKMDLSGVLGASLILACLLVTSWEDTKKRNASACLGQAKVSP